jgi:hypothetical protein
MTSKLRVLVLGWWETTVRQVPLMATLAPMEMLVVAPWGNVIWNDLKSSPLGRTAATLALPWTIPDIWEGKGG